MELFDTHAHFEGTAEEITAQLERARAAGVTRVMAIGGSEALNRGAEVAAAAKENAPLPSVGRALGWDRDQAGRELPDLDYAGVDAVGEIGLDYHYAGASRTAQMELMARQLDRARTLNLPVVIHTREADEETLGLLKDIPSRGVIHCFTGSRPFCGKLLDLGFFVSLSGIVTFKAAEGVRDVARYVPDDRLLIETDAPYLAPVPMRGRPNESAFLVHTAKFLAELRQMPLELFAALTTTNACTVFMKGCTL